MKVFYFADKLHLSKYGRFMFGETYIAMDKGHVPSSIYDIIKFIRGDGSKQFNEELKNSFSCEDNNTFRAAKKANLDFLSQSEIECLNDAILKFGKSHHFEIFNKSHKDHAYKVTSHNHEISVGDIVDSLDNKEIISKYLNNLYE